MDASTKEDLNPEDIANPRNHLLIQQSLTDLPRTLLAEPVKEFFRGEVLPKWIGSQVSP
jgi:hypothetical protein